MDFADCLLRWYDSNKRDLPWRRTRDPYAIWVSEIMLQQTRVAAVIPYYQRFLEELPDAAALSAVPEERLRKLWEGLGYYSRARHLREAAMEIVSRYGGSLPGSYEGLLALPGIGEYTAGAVASIAFGEPVPAVDGNVLRVWARLTDDHRDVLDPKVRREIRTAVNAVLPRERAGDFNAAMMELGAVVCVPNGPPRCGECPLRPLCRGAELDTARQLPVKKAKKARRIEEKTVFALSFSQGYLVYKRSDTGLLASLFQLPEAKGFLSEKESLRWLSQQGLHPTGEILLYQRKHIFTHVEWHMRVYAMEVDGGLPSGWTPLTPDMALPTAYRICLPEGTETAGVYFPASF